MQQVTRGESRIGSIVLGGGLKIRAKAIPLTTVSGTDEIDTGVEIPAGALIQNVYLDVNAVDGTTIDVGLLSSETGGDADGLLDGISTASLGLNAGNLDAAGATLGELLRVDSSGSSSLVPAPHKVGTAKTISYTLGEASPDLKGKIIVLYLEA